MVRLIWRRCKQVLNCEGLVSVLSCGKKILVPRMIFLVFKVPWVIELAVLCGIPEVKFVLVNVVALLEIKVICKG